MLIFFLNKRFTATQLNKESNDERRKWTTFIKKVYFLPTSLSAKKNLFVYRIKSNKVFAEIYQSGVGVPFMFLFLNLSSILMRERDRETERERDKGEREAMREVLTFSLLCSLSQTLIGK